MGELDYVAIDLIQSIIAHTWLIWTLASSRSFGLAHRIPLIGAYTAVPNYIFDTSTKYKSFNMTARVLCALMKTIELSAVGAFTGACSSVLGRVNTKRRQTKEPSFRPTVPIPSVWSSIAGSAVFMGLHANLRYQFINGMDRCVFERTPILPLYLMLTTSVRTVGHMVGRENQTQIVGLPTGVRSPWIRTSTAHTPVA